MSESARIYLYKDTLQAKGWKHNLKNIKLFNCYEVLTLDPPLKKKA